MLCSLVGAVVQCVIGQITLDMIVRWDSHDVIIYGCDACYELTTSFKNDQLDWCLTTDETVCGQLRRQYRYVLTDGRYVKVYD